jgi:hypothetical protein
MDPANWNVLHDGHVTAADGTVPSDLRLSIQIDYLCRYLPTQSDDVIITLIDCQQFEYHPYQQPSMSNVAAIAALNLELLSAQIDNGCISVECADGGYGGRLILRYRSANATTVEGRALTQPELESAAEHYWSDWGQSHK